MRYNYMYWFFRIPLGGWVWGIAVTGGTQRWLGWPDLYLEQITSGQSNPVWVLGSTLLSQWTVLMEQHLGGRLWAIVCKGTCQDRTKVRLVASLSLRQSRLPPRGSETVRQLTHRVSQWFISLGQSGGFCYQANIRSIHVQYVGKCFQTSATKDAM